MSLPDLLSEYLDMTGEQGRVFGFTGTRKGMTDGQKESLSELLGSLNRIVAVVHHGDCVGADAEFHGICHEFGFQIHIHPPTNQKHRAFCQSADFEEKPKAYITHNYNIVNACDLLLATPSGAERTRSGTWSTIRYARQQDKKVIVITTNGEIDVL